LLECTGRGFDRDQGGLQRLLVVGFRRFRAPVEIAQPPGHRLFREFLDIGVERRIHPEAAGQRAFGAKLLEQQLVHHGREVRPG
jgi:hypothetical protein